MSISVYTLIGSLSLPQVAVLIEVAGARGAVLAQCKRVVRIFISHTHCMNE
jgi:hypothetical protein